MYDKIKNFIGIQHSIRFQLIAGITVITVSAMVLLGFLSIKMLEWNALHKKGKEAEIIASAVQIFSQESQVKEAKGLKDFVKKISTKGIIRGMRITDESGKVVFSGGEGILTDKNDGRLLFSVKGINIKTMSGGLFEGVGKELLITTQITTQSAGKSTLVFSMPLTDLRDEGSNFRRFIFFYAVIDSLIIIMLGVYLLFRKIIRPMALLKETAEKIAGGRYNQRVNIHGSNEIGSFAESFNVMADKLEEKINKLERLNKELTITQEGLIRSEKLATVGRLAAGIAHEIGNPLSAMLGYIDILIKQKTEAAESEEILARLGKEMERIDSIVRGLLDFSRPSKDAFSTININQTIKDSIEILSVQLSSGGISFELKLGKDIPSIIIPDGKLKQVLLNLFINAKDAMPGGGKIKIETSCIDYDVRDSMLKMRKSDSNGTGFSIRNKSGAVIKISDTGQGIKEEDIDKIFDPFFTTKLQEKGTGLGLSVSLSIIEAYGGDIKVSSKEGKGTTFEVLLPIIDARRQTPDFRLNEKRSE